MKDAGGLGAAGNRLRERGKAFLRTTAFRRIIAQQRASCFAVNGIVQIVFGANDYALEINPSEYTVTTRIGQDLCLHECVGSGACFAPDWPSGDTGLRSQLKPVFHQPAHRIVVHEQQNEIGGGYAQLRAHAATAGAEEDGVTLARLCTTAHATAAALAANKKSRFDDPRENCDRLRARQ